MTWNDHDHRGEYAEARHGHFGEYAEERHRHYDLEHDDKAMERSISDLSAAVCELREQLGHALGRVAALEDANVRLVMALRASAIDHDTVRTAGMADETHLAISGELVEALETFADAIAGTLNDEPEPRAGRVRPGPGGRRRGRDERVPLPVARGLPARHVMSDNEISFEDLAADLRGWARGRVAHKQAAVELLAWHETWLRRPDFKGACITQLAPGLVTIINWYEAREFIDRGYLQRGATRLLPASASQRRVLDLAVALGENMFGLPGMGVIHRWHMAAAFAKACGQTLEGPVPEPGHNHPEFIPGDPQTCAACARLAQDEGRDYRGAAMADNEELFTHTVQAWTAGQLRKALEGIPDDFPVTVVTADEPGSQYAGAEQVIISAGPWNDRGEEGAPPDHFEIGLEFPSGEYYRRTR